MIKVLYLHGFNSSGNSTTIHELRKEIPDLLSTSYDYINADVGHSQIEALVKDALKENDRLLIGGTSLGGFWANYFSQKYKVPCVIVNPAIHPSVSLQRAVAESPLTNFNTGEVREFTMEDAARYRKYEVSVDSGIDRTLVLGKNDELLDYRKIKEHFGESAKCVLTDEGHRIENYSRIVRLIKESISRALSTD